MNLDYSLPITTHLLIHKTIKLFQATKKFFIQISSSWTHFMKIFSHINFIKIFSFLERDFPFHTIFQQEEKNV